MEEECTRAGSAQGRTSDSVVPSLRQSGGAGRAEPVDGSVASGGGTVSDTPGRGDSVGPGESPASPRIITPWQSDTWPTDAAEAIRRIDRGDIPDSYRDLVREYFSPAN